MVKSVPPTLMGRLMYKTRATKIMYRWGGSVATYGAIGTLGVVWLFDVQLSDYLKYVPVFRRRFGDDEEH